MVGTRAHGLRLLSCAIVAALGTAGAASASGSTSRTAASVHVVGSGVVVWPRVGVRTAPSLHAPVVTTLDEFRQEDYRPQPVLALTARLDASGRAVWYRISIPGRPNGRSGWVPASSIRVKPVDRWLVILRGERRFEFVLRGRVVRSGPVAVGAPGMETPLGLFYVQAKFRPSEPVLGAYAFQTSAYSKLSDWPGGGVVGVHGTNTPQLIGQAVSHGCVRLRNADIEYLRSVVLVGTPIKIVAG
jgi:lipoprotein-anchoring transpeptidase ErfK/SrfK